MTEAKDTNLDAGHLTPMSIESYQIRRLKILAKQHNENLAKLNLNKVEQSQPTPLPEKPVARKSLSDFEVKKPEETASQEKNPNVRADLKKVSLVENQ